MGNSGIFNKERDFLQHILLMSNIFYGVTPTQLRKLVYIYAESNNIKHPFSKFFKMERYECVYRPVNKNSSFSIKKLLEKSFHIISAFKREVVRLFWKIIKCDIQAHLLSQLYI